MLVAFFLEVTIVDRVCQGPFSELHKWMLALKHGVPLKDPGVGFGVFSTSCPHLLSQIC